MSYFYPLFDHRIKRMPELDKGFVEKEDFVLGLSRGDNAAYEALCEHYAALLFGIILRIVPDKEDAENVLQDCFVKIWRNIATYDAAKGRLATWLINVARNTAIDFTRSKYYAQKRKNQNLENLVSSAANMGHTTTPTDTIGLRQIVESLPPQYRQIIEWLYFQGFTQQEISEEFNIPLGTVKTRTRMALATLRQLFEVNK